MLYQGVQQKQTKFHEPFHGKGRYHIETSPLICCANQWTGFYLITASIMKGLAMPGM